jgi:hypothetical protein
LHITSSLASCFSQLCLMQTLNSQMQCQVNTCFSMCINFPQNMWLPLTNNFCFLLYILHHLLWNYTQCTTQMVYKKTHDKHKWWYFLFNWLLSNKVNEMKFDICSNWTQCHLHKNCLNYFNI